MVHSNWCRNRYIFFVHADWRIILCWFGGYADCYATQCYISGKKFCETAGTIAHIHTDMSQRQMNQNLNRGCESCYILYYFPACLARVIHFTLSISFSQACIFYCIDRTDDKKRSKKQTLNRNSQWNKGLFLRTIFLVIYSFLLFFYLNMRKMLE